jgi:hypothetical protein
VPLILVPRTQVAQHAGLKPNANGQELLVQQIHAIQMTRLNVELLQDVLGLIINVLLLVLLLQLHHCVEQITNVFGMPLLQNVVMTHASLMILILNVLLAQSASGMLQLQPNVTMTNARSKTKLAALQM